MKYEDLWAAFRGFIDAIDAGTMTTSQVRKAMLKMQNEERNGLDPDARRLTDSEPISAPSDVS